MPDALDSLTLVTGDCREVLAGMEERSVHCCITSPPYWSLRDYGLEPSVWGGDEKCQHRWSKQIVPPGHSNWESFNEYRREGYNNRSAAGKAAGKTKDSKATNQGQFCSLCGGWRGCLGLEPTPDLFAAHILEVMRLVWRVLRDDGVLWLNLGDSYTSGGRANFGPATNRGEGDKGHNAIKATPRAPQPPGLKPKDLVGIPWRVAFALQADGWYLRAALPWVKRSAMPESADDRPNSAVEYVFQLTKSARYYFDMEAVRATARADSQAA